MMFAYLQSGSFAAIVEISGHEDALSVTVGARHIDDDSYLVVGRRGFEDDGAVGVEKLVM